MIMSKCITAIVEQHRIEAAFVWFLREHSLTLPNYSLIDLSRLEDRLEAHLDALRVAGERGWEIVKSALIEGGESGEVNPAGVLAVERGHPGSVQHVADVGTVTPEGSRGLISALGWLNYEQAARHIMALLTASRPQLIEAGIAASAIHRRNPGPASMAASSSDDFALKARALRPIGELGMVDLHITTRNGMKAKDPALWFWGAWSNTLLNGHKDAVACLQNVAEAGGPYAERAAQMAKRRGTPSSGSSAWSRNSDRSGSPSLPRGPSPILTPFPSWSTR